MGRLEAIDSDCPHAALSELVEHGTPDTSDPQHDDFTMFHNDLL
jgi:hypothetical protein